MARYYYLLSINEAFLAAYLDEVEKRATRDPFASPRAAREGAFRLLRHLINDRPQLNPHDVWKVFAQPTTP